MKYDVDYFIAKYESIPEDRWCTAKFNVGNSSCALGHLGCYWISSIESHAFISDEAKILNTLMNDFFNFETCVWGINDGYSGKYQQPTPKHRILAALYDIREKELSEANLKAVNKIIRDSVGDSSRIERIPQFEVQFDSE